MRQEVVCVCVGGRGAGENCVSTKTARLQTVCRGSAPVGDKELVLENDTVEEVDGDSPSPKTSVAEVVTLADRDSVDVVDGSAPALSAGVALPLLEPEEDTVVVVDGEAPALRVLVALADVLPE